jgi:hypothetical protein
MRREELVAWEMSPGERQQAASGARGRVCARAHKQTWWAVVMLSSRDMSVAFLIPLMAFRFCRSSSKPKRRSAGVDISAGVEGKKKDFLFLFF